MLKPRFEGQPQIDAYGDFGFRLASQRFEGSVILTPKGFYPWSVSSILDTTVDSLFPVLEARDSIDFLIVGVGTQFLRWPKLVSEHLRKLGIEPDFMDTGAAARTYNILLSEDRRVAAAIIAVAK
tara:strand:- start:120583 stop:120957 length:375 start_codon:yes stop_codon:yes gene_type:complete